MPVTSSTIYILAATITKITTTHTDVWDSTNVSDYRFGFNGMEKDNEAKGQGNSYDFGARIYDSRLGRWLSVDPDVFEYPFVSPYISSLNSPIYLKDPNGKTVIIYDNDGKIAAVASKDGLTFNNGYNANSESVRNYLAAKTYIQKNDNSTLFTEMENRNEVVHLIPLESKIVPQEAKNNGPAFIPVSANEGILLWSATTALESAGGVNSPAGLLVHELHHAQNQFTDEEATKQRGETEREVLGGNGLPEIVIDYTTNNQDNKEESLTIEQTNRTLRNIPGENSNRKTHRGRLFQTFGPTSTIDKNPAIIIDRDNTDN